MRFLIYYDFLFFVLVLSPSFSSLSTAWARSCANLSLTLPGSFLQLLSLLCPIPFHQGKPKTCVIEQAINTLNSMSWRKKSLYQLFFWVALSLPHSPWTVKKKRKNYCINGGIIIQPRPGDKPTLPIILLTRITFLNVHPHRLLFIARSMRCLRHGIRTNPTWET